MFMLGVIDAMTKVAAMDTTVHEVVITALKAHLPAGKDPGQDDELETLLPEDGDLEAVVTALEENFDVHLPTDVVFSLFAEGTVKNLEKAFIKQLMTKTAAYDHAAYMRNEPIINSAHVSTVCVTSIKSVASHASTVGKYNVVPAVSVGAWDLQLADTASSGNREVDEQDSSILRRPYRVPGEDGGKSRQSWLRIIAC